VVNIFVAGQAAVDRLPQQGEQAVLGVLAGPGILQIPRRRAGQLKGIIEFTVGEESSVAGDGGPVELQLDLAVKIDAQGVIGAVTHWVPLSFRQGKVRNAGFSGEKAQTPCRNDRVIWEIQVHTGSSGRGRLIALDSTTLKPLARAALKDARKRKTAS